MRTITTAHPAQTHGGSSSAVTSALRLTLLALIGSLCLLALTARPTLAAPTALSEYAPEGNFGVGGGFGEGEFEGPTHIAVEAATGNILLVDQQNGRVDVYKPDTTYLASFDDGGAPYGIAIDQTTGAVYVSDSSTDTIKRYTSDGAPTPTYTVDNSFTSPAQGHAAGQIGSFNSALAVDPTTHDLLVADSENQLVDRFTATGTFVSSFDGSDTSGGAFTALTDVSVAPSGVIYVIDAQARVERFSALGVSQGSVAIEGSPSAVAVDPTSGALTIATENGFETPRLHTLAGGEPPATNTELYSFFAASSVPGIAIDGSSHRLYVATRASAFGGITSVELFGLVSLPGVEISAPSQVGGTTAHFAGMVDPGGEQTSIHFEFSSNAGASWSSTPTMNVGAGNGAQEVSQDFAGLFPDTTYLLRLVASNSAVSNTSEPLTFTTTSSPPGTETGGTSEVTETSAAIFGSVNPYGHQTTFYFEYGPTTAYGSRAPAVGDGVAGNGLVVRYVNRTLTGLQPQSTYHYRLVAQSDLGTSLGRDRTFTTTAVGGEGRVYEQVTPVEKDGGTVNAIIGFQAQTNGEGFVFNTTNALGKVSESASFYTRYISLRTPTGWTGAAALDPPVHSNPSYSAYPTLAVSNDFRHSFVASDEVLAPGGVSGDANFYVRDLTTGQYTFVAKGPPGTLNAITGLNPVNKYIGGASDFSWLVFMSPVPLLPGAPEVAVYRWSPAAGLSIDSVLPDGTPVGGVSASAGQHLPVVHRVSEDGSKDFFSTAEGVYMRTNGHTIAISISQVPGDPSTPHPGRLMGVSADGNYAVFNSGRLTSSAPPSAEADVYRYDVSSGELEYTGTQTETDNYLVSDNAQGIYTEQGVFYRGRFTPIAGLLGLGQFDASPDGRYFAWGSGGQVYLYDAQERTLACASCNSEGGPQSGEAELPETETSISNRVPRAITDAGQVFFTSSAKLVPADVNGTLDVYAYQAGAVHLISPGDDPVDAHFADSSDDGRDVFFATSQSLVAQDQDGTTDIYDARIGGGIPGQNDVERPLCPGGECAEFSAPADDSVQIGSEGLSSPTGNAGTGAAVPRRRATVSVTRLSVGAKALTLTVLVGEKGRLRASGALLAGATKTVGKAGTYTLKVPLSKKALAARRSRRKLKVKLKVVFSGSSGSATANLSRTLGK